VTRTNLALALDSSDSRPVFAQIADGLARAIRGGRLSPGDRLPGSRSLAASLAVHRNTVLAAYSELLAQGWIVGEAGRGTFVSSAVPEVNAQRFAPKPEGVAERPGFALPPARVGPYPRPELPRGTLSIADGVPDLRLTPVAELARAFRRAVRGPERAVLGYGFERGHPRLRAELATLLGRERGLPVQPDDVLVTRGSQMALYLAAHAVVAPGTAVAVESFGYPPAWHAFRSTGAELVPIRVDAHGLVVDELAELLQSRRISAVYVTPHHQYPTLAVLSADRRLALLELARKHRFAIVEDDYDNEIHFQGRPVLPLASADRAGVVVYVGTLSKILAPSLRVGYAVAPRLVLDRMAQLRVFVDRQGDSAMELAIAELLEDGVVQRHARRMRRVCMVRRDALVSSLRARLGDVLSFDAPPGGLALWAAVTSDIDVDAWAERSLRKGAYFRSPRFYAFDGRSRSFLRASYAALNEKELDETVKRMKAAL
jgi:GntR family transcriptional regulator/MocR family aminotransferase